MSIYHYHTMQPEPAAEHVAFVKLVESAVTQHDTRALRDLSELVLPRAKAKPWLHRRWISTYTRRTEREWRCRLTTAGRDVVEAVWLERRLAGAGA